MGDHTRTLLKARRAELPTDSETSGDEVPTLTKPGRYSLIFDYNENKYPDLYPQRMTKGSAGYDLANPGLDLPIPPGRIGAFSLNYILGIPRGYFGLVKGRSSLFRKGLRVHEGVVDSDYNDTIEVMVSNLSTEEYVIRRGERVAQFILIPYGVAEVAPPLETRRGGCGSTGTGSDPSLRGKEPKLEE